jgi:hypothetical protein
MKDFLIALFCFIGIILIPVVIISLPIIAIMTAVKILFF